MQNKNKKIIASFISSFVKKKSFGNRIFTYHSINNIKNNLTSDIYQLDPELFFNQINYLIKKKVNFDKISNFNNLKSSYILTFDDGYKNLKYNKIIDYIETNKIYSIFFVCTDFVNSNNKNYLNKEDLLEISKSNYIEIASHSFEHKKLTDLENNELSFQLEFSKKWLEDLLSMPINSIAYPFGAFDDRVINYVKKSGYRYGFTTRFNFHTNIENNFKIPRIDIWNSDNLNTFKKKVEGKWNWMNFFSKY